LTVYKRVVKVGDSVVFKQKKEGQDMATGQVRKEVKREKKADLCDPDNCPIYESCSGPGPHTCDVCCAGCSEPLLVTDSMKKGENIHCLSCGRNLEIVVATLSCFQTVVVE